MIASREVGVPRKDKNCTKNLSDTSQYTCAHVHMNTTIELECFRNKTPPSKHK